MDRARAIITDEYGLLEVPRYSRAPLARYRRTVKRALYVPDKRIAHLFKPTDFDPQLWVSADIDELIRAVSHYGRIGSRQAVGPYKGLENDPSRQQIILYTVVFDRALKHILFYRRADSHSDAETKPAVTGDSRLRGKASLGFGGHIDQIDQFQWKVLSILIPGFYQQIRRSLSLEVARIREFEEELGINGADLAHFFLAKAFRKVYTPAELQDLPEVPVHAVHICICAVAVLDTYKLAAESRPLIFRRSEIASLEWIKIVQLKQRI